MGRTTTVATRLAELVQARANCEKSGNTEWHARHSGEIMRVTREHLPHGSGVDSGCVVMMEESAANKLIIHVPFHCMDANGCYDGWRDYRVTVRPTWDGITVAVRGQDYNGLKDYLGDLFHSALTAPIVIG